MKSVSAYASPGRQVVRHHGWLVWTIFLAALVVAVGSRPWQTSTVPAAASVAASEFSAERAWKHVEMLATTIGRRVTGTEASARAADYIEAQLRGLGVETVREASSGMMELDATTYVYRGVQNVLARIPGKGSAALLVSAHYDSGAEGPGAGDNALNVAAALEIVRAIAHAAPPANTIVFNFTDGEELGLLGAAAFVRHPWFKEIAAFVNLDASGPAGRQLLLQVTPGRADLLEAYAASVPHVHGTVLAQEIFQSLPFDTDYHVYRDAGLGGVDLAPYGNNYAYHTPLDGTGRLSRRTLQESGENILALLRGVPALSPARREEAAPPATYYDLLGLVMVRYAAGTAQTIGLLIGVLAVIVACCLPAEAGSHRIKALSTEAGSRKREDLPAEAGSYRIKDLPAEAGSYKIKDLPVEAGSHKIKDLSAEAGSYRINLPVEAGSRWIALGAAAVGVSALLAILVPVLGGALIMLAGRSMFWYARPWMALCVYGPLALAGVLAGVAILRWVARRRARSPVVAAGAWQRGLVIFWALVLLVATALGLGSAYLPLWWCAGVTLALVAATYLDGARRWAVTLAGVALAAITTMQAADLLLTSLIPMSGTLGTDAPVELLIAALTALAVGPFALLAAPTIPPVPSLRRVGGYSACAVALIAGMIGSSFPYTPERPKRAYLDVRASGEGGARVVIEATDPGPDLPLSDVALDAAIARPMPAIEVRPAAAAGSHELRLSAPGAYLVDVRVDGGTIAWPGSTEAGSSRHLVWVGTEDPLAFRVKGTNVAPVNVEAKAFYLDSEIALDHVLTQLPRWSTPTVQTVLEARAGF